MGARAISASAALQGVRAPSGPSAGKTGSSSNNGKEKGDDKAKEGGSPEGRDAEAEQEEEEEDESPEDENDEEDNPEVPAAARAVSSVEVDNEGANAADDTGDGSDSLLRQYQYNFDDSQVDYDLILALLHYIFKSEFCKDGSVLVFMPGWDDISRMYRILSTTREFMDAKKYKLIQLHSGIPRKAQDAAFEPLQPGEHKIILSTNIAETSITIDDVAVVIDSGRVKEKMYDPHVKLAFLKSSWISQASARQRKGRAGRTRAGVCFHLFSRRRHSSLPEFQDSELLRMPLEELVLQVTTVTNFIAAQ
jgi:HrpA-like RNA helicase